MTKGNGKKKNSAGAALPLPTFIQSGIYLSLSDYARYEGIGRQAAHLRVKRGEVTIIKVGRCALVRVLTSDDIPM